MKPHELWHPNPRPDDGNVLQARPPETWGRPVRPRPANPTITDTLLERFKAALEIKTDYRLAKVLGVSHTSVMHWRSGRSRPDDLVVIRMARLMHSDPAPLVAELHAERAKDPESRALWLRIAGQLQATAACDCSVCRSNPVSPSPPPDRPSMPGPFASTPEATAAPPLGQQADLTPELVRDMFHELRQKGALPKRRITDVRQMDYHDQYLKSAKWKRIKKRVMERDGGLCQSCGGRGSTVHHRSYEREVLEGRNDAMLATVCNGCHNIIHFLDDGQRRPEAEWDAVFLLGQHQTDIPAIGKVDLRSLKIVDRPDLTRMTAVQIELYRKAHLRAIADKREASRLVAERKTTRRASASDS